MIWPFVYNAYFVHIFATPGETHLALRDLARICEGYCISYQRGGEVNARIWIR